MSKIYLTLPDGWLIEEHFPLTKSAPRGFVWINNNKSFFSGERKRALMTKPSKLAEMVGRRG